MNNILNIIKSEFPDKAKDILESLELLNEAISSTIDDISSELNEALKSRDKTSMNKYNELASEGFKYEEIIENIIRLLSIEDDIDKDKADNMYNKHSIPNYSDYMIDNWIEHTLLEDFKHKRPFGFKFISDEIIEANTWKEVFIKTCEIAYDIEPKRFNEFENMSHMKGMKKKYFSKDKKELRRPIQIRNDIFVETNHSANTLRDLIIKIIQEFNFEISDYKVYFVADYTDLKKNDK